MTTDANQFRGRLLSTHSIEILRLRDLATRMKQVAVPTGTTEKPPVPDAKKWYEKTPTDIPGVQRVIDIVAPETVRFGLLKGKPNPIRQIGAALTHQPGPGENPQQAAIDLQNAPPWQSLLMGQPIGAPAGSIMGTAVTKATAKSLVNLGSAGAKAVAREAAPVARRLATEEVGAVGKVPKKPVAAAKPATQPVAPVTEPVLPARGPMEAKRPVTAAAELIQPPAAGPGRSLPGPAASTAPVGTEAGQIANELSPVSTGAPPIKPPVTTATGAGTPGEPPLPAGEPNNPIGLRDITPGLSKQQEISNIARRLVTKGTLGVASPIEHNPVSTAAMTERARVQPIISSVANALGTSAQAKIESAFKMDKTGGITSLIGVDPTIRGVPTIADVAARLPTFASSLSAEQKAVLESLRQTVTPYRTMLESKGLDIGKRTDVMEGGFYLPRGRADLEGADLPIKVRTSTGAGGGKRGFERSAVFGSQAEGIAKGYEYAPIGQALTSYARDAGGRATEAHVANYFKGITDETGNVIGQTLKAGEAVPRDRQIIALPGIQGYTYPDEIANAANKILNKEGPTRGALSDVVNAANAFNNLYRGMRATLDDSALGVQGLLGMAGDQKAYARALKLNIQAWGVGGDKALGKFFVDFDQRAAADGALSIQEWAQQGLHIGGAISEFQIGQGVGKLAQGVQGLPVIRQANRAFGYFGDGLRASWANDEIKSLLGKGHTLDEIISSGDAEKIATAVNNGTGWARGKAFGSLGELALFAPKFLESRAETIVRGIGGLRPGASVDQRIARNSLLKLIGGATMLTVAANTLLGQDTDFRPIVDGRRNPKFMRILYQGRYYSLLGTWDSLAGAIINTATLHPNVALRGMASGVVSDAWDLIGGRDYNYNRTRDTPAHFAMWLLNSMAPFSAGQAPQAIGTIGKGVAESDPFKALGGGVNAVSQVTGFKSYPASTPTAKGRSLPSRSPRLPARSPRLPERVGAR